MGPNHSSQLDLMNLKVQTDTCHVMVVREFNRGHGYFCYSVQVVSSLVRSGLLVLREEFPLSKKLTEG